MSPRYRRALIPGLLVALLVAVVVAAVTGRARADDGADGTPGRVSTITDARLPESSGLVVSTRDPGWAYTLNDSADAPRVFTVSISTGRVVGVTTLTGYDLRDTAALTIDRAGRLWVADIGDNEGVRTTVALYSMDQPGRGATSVRPVGYVLRYPDGPPDAETLLADPSTGAMYVVSKGMLDGQVYRVPSRLDRRVVNGLTSVPGAAAPVLATDGGFTPDGTHVVVRNYLNAAAYDARTWRLVWSTVLPRHRQGESLAVEPGGRSFLVGTEGLPSPILRAALPARLRADGLQPAGGVIDASS